MIDSPAVTSASHSSHFTYNGATRVLTIDASAPSTAYFTATLVFSMKNSYSNNFVYKPVANPVSFELYDCESDAIDVKDGTQTKAYSTISNAATVTKTWLEFTFSDTFCLINLYTLECKDKNSNVVNVDESNNVSGTGLCKDNFTFNTAAGVRSMTWI